MATIEVVVCQICAELGKPTMPYEITQGRRHAEVDLCVDDARLLESLLSGIRVPKAKRKEAASAGRRGGPGRGVTSMEEIERAKQVALARNGV